MLAMAQLVLLSSRLLGTDGKDGKPRPLTGLPYAMRRAGWFGFVLMMVATVVASFPAKMLVWSFNTINERKQSSTWTLTSPQQLRDGSRSR